MNNEKKMNDIDHHVFKILKEMMEMMTSLLHLDE